MRKATQLRTKQKKNTTLYQPQSSIATKVTGIEGDLLFHFFTTPLSPGDIKRARNHTYIFVSCKLLPFDLLLTFFEYYAATCVMDGRN